MTPVLVGEVLPAAMGPADLQRALRISPATFFRRQAEGKFDRFLLPNPTGPKKFSGRLVQAHLDGGAKR